MHSYMRTMKNGKASSVAHTKERNDTAQEKTEKCLVRPCAGQTGILTVWLTIERVFLVCSDIKYLRTNIG